jgi:dipeptidyl aminopeptidase/acylaminoacyl peptidase
MRSLLCALVSVVVCALALTTVSSVAAVSAAPASTGPSARDIVEFTQIVQPFDQNDDGLQDQVSPDGTQAFIVTRRADVASDTNRYEIQLLDLRPDRLAAQSAPGPVILLSVAVSQDGSFADPAIQHVQWHDDRTLEFLGRPDGQSFQAYRLDVPTRALVPLTHESNRIVAYAVSQDLLRVVYAVQVPNPPLRPGAHGVVVGTRSFWSVKFGQQDLRAQDRMYQYVVADTASPRPARPLGDAFVVAGGTKPTVSISPDGRWALLPRWDLDRLTGWARQYPMVGELAKEFAVSQQYDPLHYFSNPATYVPRRLSAWRLDDGQEQSVVDAPDDVHSGGPGRRDLFWQASSGSVILAGTHLPPSPDGTTSPASHIIEYWPDEGRWTDIATLDDRLEDAHPLRDGFLVVDGARHRLFRRRAEGGWRESTGGTGAPSRGASAWTPRVVQGLNQPPDVYAEGPAGQTRRLSQLNPQFNPATWGEMRPYTWRDAAGRQWDGGLMTARTMDVHSRYPLLIQTYGFSPDRFFLDGPNPRDGATSGFAGRAFLREGILVLQMPWSASSPTGSASSARAALAAFNEGVRGAVDALVREGRVDPAKVGIIGFSATGERVLNLVTFGDVPIRAATTADGDANTLFAFTVSYGKSDVVWASLAETNDGWPYGGDLAAWMRNDPALHTDCIRAALRFESYGPWVLPGWDLYALLRRQYKPAEMVVIPGGSHSLLAPGDRMVSLQGNVDWYAFWLAGRTRTVPVLAAETVQSLQSQYAQWQQMASLKAADEARPRCAR